ncbi:MAG TPA: FKBP-type peptidyl-prolyl cis-trans isomerase [Thermoanaerobaculia bacterium]|nr:FKBP-type peptidyl-prolyl cis-trans isomerase [Thermoanaerobaculia bacterium]
MRLPIVLFALPLAVAAPVFTQETAPPVEAPAPPAAPAGLESEDAKTVYAVGFSLWRNLAQLDLSPEEVAIVRRALDDAAAGREPAISIDQYTPKIQAFARARSTRRAAAEKEKGVAFLAAAAAEPGAVKTESGLVYRELVAGTGAVPAATDTVSVHYRGTLVDGTQFDSSYERGEPAQFPLNRVVRCWTEGLQLMKVGGKARLVCPSDLAYGDRGRPSIPPGATLVFEVELLDIVVAPVTE